MDVRFLPTLSLVLMCADAILANSPMGTQVDNAPCNSCCTGPPGMPGVHGVPGNNGLPGPTGPRGDMGYPGAAGVMGTDGAKGERGSPGSTGQKGEQGIGQPGKRGPPGLSGSPEMNGQVSTGDGPNRRVAFTAVRKTPINLNNDPIPFEEIIYSEKGTPFNLLNGTFTCDLDGIYFFTFSVTKTPTSSSLFVHLLKNTQVIVVGVVFDKGSHPVGGSAVLSLNLNDEVFMTARGAVDSLTPNHYTSFSGFLLYDK